MNLFETNSNRQSIKYYIKEKISLYLVINKGIDIQYKEVFIKHFKINEINSDIWWMDYTEKGKSDLDIIYNWNIQYSLFEKEEEALEYIISSLKSTMIKLDRKICELSERLWHL